MQGMVKPSPILQIHCLEYALQDIHKPMGVSEFKLDKMLPDNLKSNLPSIEELEEQLKRME